MATKKIKETIITVRGLEEVKQLLGQLNKLLANIATRSDESINMEELRTELQGVVGKTLKKYQSAENAFDKKIAEFEQEKIDLEAALNSIEEAKAELKDLESRKILSDKIKELNALLEDLKREKAELETKLATYSDISLELENSKLDSISEEVITNLSILSNPSSVAELEEKNNEISRLNERISSLEEQLAVGFDLGIATAIREEALQDVEGQKAEAFNAGMSLKAQEVARLENEIEIYNESFKELEIKLAEFSGSKTSEEYLKLEEEYNLAKKEVENLRVELEKLKAENAKSENELKATRNNLEAAKNSSYTDGYNSGYGSGKKKYKTWAVAATATSVGLAAALIITGSVLGVQRNQARDQVNEYENIFASVSDGQGLLAKLMSGEEISEEQKAEFLNMVAGLKGHGNSNIKNIGTNMEGMLEAASKIGQKEQGLKAYLDFIYQLENTKNIYNNIIADGTVSAEEKAELEKQLAALNNYEDAALSQFNRESEEGLTLFVSKDGQVVGLNASNNKYISSIFSTAANFYDLQNSSAADKEELQAQIDQLNSQKSELDKQIADLQAQLDESNSENSELKNQIEGLNNQKLALEEQIKDLENKEKQYLGLLFETNKNLVDMLGEANKDGFAGFSKEQIDAFSQLSGYTEDIQKAYKEKFGQDADFATDFSGLVNAVNTLATTNLNNAKTVADYTKYIGAVNDAIAGLYTKDENGNVTLKPVYTMDENGNVSDNSENLLASLKQVESEINMEGLKAVSSELTNMLKGTGTIQKTANEYKEAIEQINSSIQAINDALADGSISEEEAAKLKADFAAAKNQFAQEYISEYLDLVESVESMSSKSAETIKNLQDQIASKESEIADKQAQIDSLSGDKTALEAEKAALEAEKAELLAEIEELKKNTPEELLKQLEAHKKNSTFVNALYTSVFGEIPEGMTDEEMRDALKTHLGLSDSELGKPNEGDKDEAPQPFNN